MNQYKYSAEHQALLPLPEVERPSENNTDFGKKFFGEAHNEWLSRRLTVLPEHKEYWRDGDLLTEGVDFESYDSNKWFHAVCKKCGWQGSSEKLLGGGQIADTGDYGDCYCPKCDEVVSDEHESGQSYVGLVAIPLLKQSSNPKQESGEDKEGSFYNAQKQIKYTGDNGCIAVANSERQAEIITKVLNHYFNNKHFTNNDAVEMMHRNTSTSLTAIADFLEKHEYTGEQAIEYLREIADELGAQALVVSLRDELRFDAPLNPSSKPKN